MSPRKVSKGIFKTFPFRRKSTPPPKKNTQNWRRSNRYLTLTSLQPRERSVDRYCLLFVVVKGLVNLFVRRTVSELRASKLPNFRILPIFYIQNLKYLPGRSLQPRVNQAECFLLCRVVVKGPKSCLLLVGFFCNVW